MDSAPIVTFKDPRLPSKFWARVTRSTNGCWHWTGYVAKSNYGYFWVTGRGPVPAHRHAYNVLVEELAPKGHEDHKQVDHECHNRSATCQGGPTCQHRRCVNPNHMVAKLPGLNTAASRHTPASKNSAKTHCIRGHLLAGDNLRIDSLGRRNCYTCKLEKGYEAKARRLAKERGEDWSKTEWNALKTHCPQGHPYDEENTYWYQNKGGGWARSCRTCIQERSRRHQEAKRNGTATKVPKGPKTHCKRGHELSGDNLYVSPQGTRGCKECRRANKARRTAAGKR